MKSWSFLIFCSLALLHLTGCNSSPPQFSNRAEFDDLEPYAQEYVSEVLDSYFGTPTESVAWERLPIEYHFAETTVSGSPSPRKVTLDVSAGGHGSIGPGTEIHFASSNESNWITEWDAATGLATLERKPTQTIAEGEAVIVGPGAILKNGRHLYAQHCQHCHGVSGDGNGPTARYLNPLPRDYRNGRFKFTTTNYDFSPSRDDLDRVIREGIPGTYMPSFKLLKQEEMQAIVEYVRWLSMRGEIEKQLIETALADYTHEAVKLRIDGGASRGEIETEFNKRVAEGEIQESLDVVIDLMVERWKGSDLPENMVQVATNRPPATPESIARGRQLYLDVNNKCASCHGDAGFGDGPQNYAFTPGKPGPGLYDDWNNPVKPRNLHTGIYRGGRRPYDLFCRIRASVKGTPMPKFDTMKEEDVWDLVNYVYSIPYEEEVAGSGRLEEMVDSAESETEPAAAESESNEVASR
ncbi:MAG: cytochrome c [Planctomycetaceae bacterium]|nr:cytochrome c [Planctomycetaceae bacterium]